MPRWPAGHKKRTDRNYAKETAYESQTLQKKRRADRNRARRKAISQGRVRKGDNMEVDHRGFHRRGRLKNVPTSVVTRHANRIRQPKRS